MKLSDIRRATLAPACFFLWALLASCDGSTERRSDAAPAPVPGIDAGLSHDVPHIQPRDAIHALDSADHPDAADHPDTSPHADAYGADGADVPVDMDIGHQDAAPAGVEDSATSSDGVDVSHPDV